MDTETKLVASTEQARELIKKLEEAVVKAEETGEAAYARVVLEQMSNNGPWRLVVGVLPDEQ